MKVWCEIRERLGIVQIYADTNLEISEAELAERVSNDDLKNHNVTASIGLSNLPLLRPIEVSSVTSHGSMVSVRLTCARKSSINPPLKVVKTKQAIPKCNVPLQISCMECKAAIYEEIKLKRVLELPSTGLEPGDYFCHGENFSARPKDGDFLFSLEGYALGGVPSLEKCPQCGVEIGSRGMLWTSSVSLSHCGKQDPSFEILYALVSEHDRLLLVPPLGRGTPLYLWVIDRSLCFTNVQSDHSSAILPPPRTVFKVLFLENPHPDLPDANEVNCPQRLVNTALNLLNLQTGTWPESLRSAVPGFKQSYLDISQSVSCPFSISEVCCSVWLDLSSGP